MPIALGQHQALFQTPASLSGYEKLYAFLDDIDITSLMGKAMEAHTIVEQDFWTQASTSTMAQKKNRGGVEPENIALLTSRFKHIFDGSSLVFSHTCMSGLWRNG